MDTFSLVIAIPAAAFLLWGGYVCVFCHDRRISADRRARLRPESAGRRRSDARAVAVVQVARPIELLERRAA